MAYTPVLFLNQASTNTNETTIVFSVGVNTTAGDTLYLFIANDAGTANDVSSITDTQGNTWARRLCANTSNPMCDVWYCNGSAALTTTGNGGSADQVTVNFTAATIADCIGVDLPGSPTIDKTNTASGASTTISVSSGTLSEPYEIVIAAAAMVNAAGGITWASPVNNLLATQHVSGGTWGSVAYEDVSATTSVTASATITSAAWTVAILTFQYPAPIFSAATWPGATQGTSYSSTVGEATVYAGSSPTYSISSGSLPPGITLTTTSGLISGTPTKAGTYTFTLKCVDGNSNSSTKSGTIQVLSNLAIVSPISLNGGIQGLPVTSGTYSATGGTSPYTYTISTGSLPSGMSLGSSSGTISGTPTSSGTYTFVVSVEDSLGYYSYSLPQTLFVASSSSNVPAIVFPNNLLTQADSQMLAGNTWVADTNATSVSIESACVVEGTTSLEFVSVAAGDMSVHTGYYPVQPNKPYVVSGCVLPTAPRDTYCGVEWFTSSHVLIGSVALGNSDPSSGPSWQPVCLAATSPSNAAYARVVGYIGATAAAGESGAIDMFFFAQSNEQVLIDWINPAFSEGTSAGQSFLDATPFVRMDTGITINRGRQNAITQMPPGSATFTIDTASGHYMSGNTSSVISGIGGQVTLGQRCQINLADQNGLWYTRFDGPIGEIDYVGDNTGQTMLAEITVADVLAYLNRSDPLNCWTKEQVLSNEPLWHWTLNDVGNAGGAGVAVESSGNNGPALRALNSDTTGTAAIAWQSGNGGVETLANSVMPGQPDGSDAWPDNGQYGQASNPCRGLESGVAGPYLDYSETQNGFTLSVSTPLPTVYFTPKLTALAAANEFTGNTGYGLVAELPVADLIEIGPSNINGWSFECWFTLDPNVAGDVADKYGPYTVLSLGSSRTGTTLVAAVLLGSPTSGNLGFEVATYPTPPAFQMLQWGTLPSVLSGQSGSVEINNDKTQLPHHLVIEIQPGTTPVLTAWLDNNQIISYNMLPQTVFDTVCVGSSFGGCGAFYGGISLVSVYNYQLSLQQIATDCMLGQYGMWEQTTDNCVERLANYSNIPGFWYGFVGQNNGLTLTDYIDITAANPLSEMQLFAQAELGLIFVNASGQLTYHTRDWRMGYGPPDFLLPPDTFDANMGLNVLDQYMINEQAVNTQVYATGAAWVNGPSQDQYGTYATNGIGSPLTLPMISWQRAAAELGVSSYLYWADPVLMDYAQWQANSRANPRLCPTSLTIDLKTLTDITSDPTCTISALYALEIDNMIAPTPASLPANYPSTQAVVEWFIEGINETITQTSRTITFYTSPAGSQRAWRPGNTTYGQLDTNALLGVSQADFNPVQATGKDVSHDAGPPYWPPTDAFSGWSTSPNEASTSTTTMLIYYGGNNAGMMAVGDTFTNNASRGGPFTITAIGTVQDAASSVTVTYTPASSSDFATTDVLTCTNHTNANNPVGNGRDFVGGLEMRGLTWNLQNLIQPPICAVGTMNNAQTIPSGPNTTPTVAFDTIFIDTAGGMGLVSGYPNWYVVTVPGFYDIDISLAGAASIQTDDMRSWIIVAQSAAQAVAAGTATPWTCGAYANPVGEIMRFDEYGREAVCTGTVRLYLGLGDMVTMGVVQNTGSSQHTGVTYGSVYMSLIYRGLGQTSDQVEVASLVEGSNNGTSGSSTPPAHNPPPTTTTSKFYAADTYSYFGSTAYYPNQLRASNSTLWQAVSSGDMYVNGSMYSFVCFNWSAIKSAIGTDTVTAVTLRCQNEHFWYDSGGVMLLGYQTTYAPGGTTFGLGAHSHPDQQQVTFSYGQTKTFSVGSWCWSYLKAGTMTGFILGNGSTQNLEYYSYWNGAPGAWYLTVTHKN